MSEPCLLLSARPCDQCLTTRNRVVSGHRAAEIVRDCRRTGNHFFCHKHPCGLVHCAGVHALHQSTAYRLALALGIPVVLTEPPRGH